jgi:hypothetical protein
MDIPAVIESSVSALQLLPEFEQWRSTQAWNDGDFCVFNSSFLLRDGVATNQATRRLALRSNRLGQLTLAGTINMAKMLSPFKRLASNSSNLEIRPLAESIESEVDRLGDVLFTLIGDLAPAAVGSVPINGIPGVTRVELDTAQAAVAQIKSEALVVNMTHDEAAIWSEMQGRLESDSCRSILAKALEVLEDKASRHVAVPVRGSRPLNPLLKELSSGLETQALEYQEALDSWTSSSHSNEGSLHQILRISYNFASDAVRLIRIMISVCDLKPLVYWCTIKEHLALDTALKALPWQDRSKASLAAYIKIVNDARNHAFHDLFPVVSGLVVELPDAALKKVRLHLFARHGSKNNRNEVQFEDQELVDLLTEFTRAGRRATPPQFWEQNLATMQAALDLLEATTGSLSTIRECS